MIRKIKNLKLDLLNCGNKDKDDSLRNEIRWISDQETRLREIGSIISFIKSEKDNYPQIYMNFRRLDFWREIYNEKEVDFDSELKGIVGKDSSKLIVKYTRWSQVNQKLPEGSYIACGIPTSYWYRTPSDDFKTMLEDWDK
jgi:hypothetical protein